MQVSAGPAAVPAAVKPKVVGASAASLPFQDSLRTLTDGAAPERTPPHSGVALCDPGQFQVTVQPLIAEVPADPVGGPEILVDHLGPPVDEDGRGDEHGRDLTWPSELCTDRVQGFLQAGYPKRFPGPVA